mgnify:FL=1
MIFRSFLLALGQLGDGRFLRVVLIGVALSVALLFGVYFGFVALLDSFAPETLRLPWIGEIGSLDRLIGWGSAVLMLVLSIFLMVPVAALFSGIFLDDVAKAVEDRHYPYLPAAPRVRLGDSLIASVNFFGVLIAVNVVALLLYGLVGPFAPLMFWIVNGYLLGREYFGLAAIRRLGRAGARDLRRRNAVRIWLAGILMAAPLSLPLVNLVIPVLGAATFTHLFHAMAGEPSRQG